MKPNGMQGPWKWPARGPGRGHVLDALPQDGSPITRGELIQRVHAVCAAHTDGAISGWIHDMALDRRSPLLRVDHGVYCRKL